MSEPKGEMPEPETDAQAADVAANEGAPVVEEKFDEARAMETIKKLREIEKQAKKDKTELEKLRAQEEEHKKAQMTESERLKAELDQAMAELKAKSTRAMQLEVAGRLGLPTVLADRLKGETPEEMEADAKAMLEALPKQRTAPNSGTTNPGDKASKTETRAEKKARLLGSSPDIWAGGGINWGEQTPKE